MYKKVDHARGSLDLLCCGCSQCSFVTPAMYF